MMSPPLPKASPPSVTRYFWENLDAYGQSIALIEDDRTLTYSQLACVVAGQQKYLFVGEKKLVFLASDRSMQGVICYLALLAAGHTVFLCGEIERTLVETYRPAMILSRLNKLRLPCPENYKAAGSVQGHDLLVCIDASDVLPANMCLLLSTSGSTGTSKLVRLSYDNIATAAEQMCKTLKITDADRAITSVPLDHVYGLSILHSHLTAGAAVVLTKKSVMDKGFWDYMRNKAVSSLGGVPWTYKVMKDIGVSPESFPALRKLHQSGAKLDSETAGWLIATFPPHGVELYFMYGQTEAAGRMCVLPPELAKEKMGSVGFAVPGGKIELNEENEVVYSGPNVMLGYASCREDLYRGDDLNGVLHTGDLGTIDDSNCLYLTGRLSRFCKILGNRINLDDLESFFPNAAAVGDDTLLTLYFEAPPSRELSDRADMLACRLRIPRRSITLRHVKAFPRSAAGKIVHDKLHAAMAQSMLRDDDD